MSTDRLLSIYRLSNSIPFLDPLLSRLVSLLIFFFFFDFEKLTLPVQSKPDSSYEDPLCLCPLAVIYI